MAKMKNPFIKGEIIGHLKVVDKNIRMNKGAQTPFMKAIKGQDDGLGLFSAIENAEVKIANSISFFEQKLEENK